MARLNVYPEGTMLEISNGRWAVNGIHTAIVSEANGQWWLYIGNRLEPLGSDQTEAFRRAITRVRDLGAAYMKSLGLS